MKGCFMDRYSQQKCTKKCKLAILFNEIFDKTVRKVRSEGQE